jgi:hypothetical protein
MRDSESERDMILTRRSGRRWTREPLYIMIAEAGPIQYRHGPNLQGRPLPISFVSCEFKLRLLLAVAMLRLGRAYSDNCF